MTKDPFLYDFDDLPDEQLNNEGRFWKRKIQEAKIKALSQAADLVESYLVVAKTEIQKIAIRDHLLGAAKLIRFLEQEVRRGAGQ